MSKNVTFNFAVALLNVAAKVERFFLQSKKNLVHFNSRLAESKMGRDFSRCLIHGVGNHETLPKVCEVLKR